MIESFILVRIFDHINGTNTIENISELSKTAIAHVKIAI
jgi:hypothetical protein